MSPRLARASRLQATNRKENNPTQVEAEAQIFGRAGCKPGDACAERIDFRPSRARRFWCGPMVNDKSVFRRT